VSPMFVQAKKYERSQLGQTQPEREPIRVSTTEEVGDMWFVLEFGFEHAASESIDEYHRVKSQGPLQPHEDPHNPHQSRAVE